MPYKEVPKSMQGRGRPRVTDEAKAEAFREKYPWAVYLGGVWQRVRPRRAGLYPIATRSGDFAGYREFIERDGTIVDALAPVNEPGWEGWIWSERLPEPPKSAADWYDVAPKLVPPLTEDV